jgi:hypothetical protein
MFTTPVEIFELLNTKLHLGSGNTAEALVAPSAALFRTHVPMTNH